MEGKMRTKKRSNVKLFTRVTSCAMVIMLVLSCTACQQGNAEGNGNIIGNIKTPTEHYYPLPELRSKEEIAQTGLTGQDVFDSLNNLCLEIIKKNFEEKYKDHPNYPYLSTQFIQITVADEFGYPNGPDNEGEFLTPSFFGQQEAWIDLDWAETLTMDEVYVLSIDYN